jgi:hypothetical protein
VLASKHHFEEVLIMGGAKRWMMERDEKISSVLFRLIEAGAVAECEIHEYPIDQYDNGAVEEVLKELTAEVGKDEAENLVEEAMSQAYCDCPSCEKNARD